MAAYIQRLGPQGPMNDWGIVRKTRKTIHRGGAKQSWDIVEVQSPNDTRYQFVRSLGGPVYSYYSCNECKLLKEEYSNDELYGETARGIKAPTIKIYTDIDHQLRHWTNPMDPSQPHVCTGLTVEQCEGKEKKREAKEIVSTSTKRPRQAYEEVVRNVHTERHANKEQILLHLGEYNSNNSSALTSNSAKKYPSIPSVEGIPRQLCLTFADLKRDDGGINAQEYIFFKQNDPPFLIMGSRSDLQILYESPLWLYDGTFDLCPQAPVDRQRVNDLLAAGNVAESRRVKALNFTQLFSIHGFVNGECKTGIIALLPDKTQATYERLFYLVIQRILDEFQGGEGTFGLNSVRSDFELASVNAIINVGALFDMNIDAGGCVFHYTQSIHRNLQHKGLQALYNKSPRYADDRYQRVREWIRKLDAMCLFPPEYADWLWQHHLSQPPLTLDAEIDTKTVEMATYYENQWMHNMGWFNYWAREGPRTNNHVEAWNGTLKYHIPTLGKLSLTKFLTAYQEKHLYQENRTNGLRSGWPPNPRPPKYIRNDEEIEQAQHEFIVTIAEYEENIIAQQTFVQRCYDYLLRIAHCLGRH